MKKLCVSVWMIAVANLAAAPALALTISLEPAQAAVVPGEVFSLDLRAEGLDGALSLGAWDVSASFDPASLRFEGAALGDPVLGDQLDLFGLGSINGISEPLPGSANLFQISLDLPEDLASLQADSFVLGRLDFRLIGRGPATIGLSANALSDGFGEPLAATVRGAEVAAIPEPGAALLFSAGTLVVGVALRWNSSRAR